MIIIITGRWVITFFFWLVITSDATKEPQTEMKLSKIWITQCNFIIATGPGFCPLSIHTSANAWCTVHVGALVGMTVGSVSALSKPTSMASINPYIDSLI